VAAVTLLLLTGPAALLISFISSTTTAEEVTARVSPEVFRQLAADSRAQRLQNSRAVLAAANDALAELGLPMVADPGPTANPEQVAAAASSAQVLSVLPRDVVERLRDQTSGDVLILPQADGTIVRPGLPGPGSAPDQPGGGTPAPPGAEPGGTSTTPSSRRPAPSPAPAPGPRQAPTDDGLLPDFIPIPRLLQPLLSA
jgi:hypothetical protein